MLQTRLLDIKYCGYPGLTGVYILTAANGDAALIDSGTPRAFEPIMKELDKMRIKPDQLKSIFLTHGHLDHSGGVSIFTRNLPHIKVFCSLGAAQTLMHPEFLIPRMAASLGRHWGKEFGNEVRPVSPKFLNITHNHMRLPVGRGRAVEVLDTPGHAHDHISFVDNHSSTAFVGDSFGLRYTTIDPTKSIFTSVPYFDPTESYNSLNMLSTLRGIKKLGLAHFGWVDDIQSHTKQCRYFLDSLITLAKRSDNLVEDLKKLYESVYGVDCMKKWHRLNGSFGVNYAGLKLHKKLMEGSDLAESEFGKLFKVKR